MALLRGQRDAWEKGGARKGKGVSEIKNKTSLLYQAVGRHCLKNVTHFLSFLFFLSSV